MTKKQKDEIIRNYLTDYLTETNHTKRTILYNKHIHPYFMNIITGALRNHRLNTYYDYVDISIDDLIQDAYKRIMVNIFDLKKLSKVNSIIDFAFIIARNEMKNTLFRLRTNRKHHLLLVDEGSNEALNILLGNVYEVEA